MKQRKTTIEGVPTTHSECKAAKTGCRQSRPGVEDAARLGQPRSSRGIDVGHQISAEHGGCIKAEVGYCVCRLSEIVSSFGEFHLRGTGLCVQQQLKFQVVGTSKRILIDVEVLGTNNRGFRVCDANPVTQSGTLQVGVDQRGDDSESVEGVGVEEKLRPIVHHEGDRLTGGDSEGSDGDGPPIDRLIELSISPSVPLEK